MSQNLYFAYGSNLNLSDLNAWLRKHGYPAGLLKFHSHVWLPDFEPAFTYRSESRGGGVLSIRERIGSVVEGVLFEVGDGGWEALDRKEGAPNCYERTQVTVLGPCGEEVSAVTYRVLPLKEKTFVRPTDDYVSVVREGMHAWGICDQAMTAASRNRVPPLLDGIFVYGTLLRGESRFPMLSEHGIECAVLAETFGHLADLGPYPALFDLDSTDSIVRGEFIRLKLLQSALRKLDVVEGFRGFGIGGSLFRRTRINVDVGDGRIRSAWTYCMDFSGYRAKQIPSGDWRVRCGKREPFIESLVEQHVGNQETAVVERIAGSLPFSFMDQQSAVALLLPLRDAMIQGRLSERKLAQASGCWAAIPFSH